MGLGTASATKHLNTPRLIADSTGTTVWQWDNQEPFGNDVPNANPAGAGAFEFNLRFPGQYYDRETGLAYNYFRDYDSAIGRYILSDPIGLRGGINTYAYVRGNPLSFGDPTGEADVRIDNANRAAGLPGPESMQYGQGCGDPKSDKYIPDLYPEACTKHDRCYKQGCKSQKECDKDFFYDMLRERPWLTVYPAFTFYLGVRWGGEDAYNAQRKQR